MTMTGIIDCSIRVVLGAILIGFTIQELSAKSISCSFRDFGWEYSNKTINTCCIENQTVDDDRTMISSPFDEMVEGLVIKNEKNFEFIPSNAGDLFPNLTVFEIFNCSLKIIHKKSFNNLENLQVLGLPHNKIEIIDKNAFNELLKLERLDLSQNKIEYISVSLFQPLENLKELYLGGNSLQFLHDDVFKNLVNLRMISLRHNKLEMISANLLKTNAKLENVWLNGNNINQVDVEAFDGKSDLLLVDLSRNRCTNSIFDSEALEKITKEVKEHCQPHREVLLKGQKLKELIVTSATICNVEKSQLSQEVEKLKLQLKEKENLESNSRQTVEESTIDPIIEDETNSDYESTTFDYEEIR